jgi:pimeloyl-ACP methyl ester carboxylesterase
MGAVGAGIAGLSLPSAFARAEATPEATPTVDKFAGLVDIGGRSLYLDCRGSGGPTVILEAGAGNNAQIWDTIALPPGSTDVAVMPGVATFTRVCAYDRPGTLLDLDNLSRSDPVPMPRTAADMVADLHALLVAASVPGPYVLAAHSFGGLIARLYATTFPDEVAGLVLVDAVHEVYYDQLRAVTTPAQWATATLPPPAVVADYPEFEQIDPDASGLAMREATAASPLGLLPVVVLSRGLPADAPPGFPADAIEGAWAAGQNELAMLAPGDRHVIANESAHYIQLDQPDLVIEAIRQVVEAVRDPDTWATPMATGDDVSGIQSGGSKA